MKSFWVSSVQDNGGTVLGEAKSQAEADAAIRAGDQDASMGEVEEIFVHEWRSIASCGQKSWKV